MISNQSHLQVISALDKLPDKQDQSHSSWVQKCLGSNKPTRCLKSADISKIAKSFSPDIDLINSLYQNGTTFEELSVAANLAGRLDKKYYPMIIDKWLNFCHGWCEIDSLCQTNFSADILLNNWPKWRQFLIKLSKSKNISKRRASLVLLCKSLRQSSDPRLSDFSLELVERLKSEKDILITKAVSWILRSLVKHHSVELKTYLEKNQNSLPKITYRETLKKLTTGKKN